MKEIRRAENAGFCFGVKQAIEKAEKAAEQNPGEIYSMGSLIHNERVTKDLEKKGIRVIESLDEIEIPESDEETSYELAGPKVIIRSHGEGRALYEKASAQGIQLIDATCPFVARIHHLVNDTDKQVVTGIIRRFWESLDGVQSRQSSSARMKKPAGSRRTIFLW